MADISFFAFYSWNQFLAQYAKGREKVTDIGLSGVLGTIAVITLNILFLVVIKLGLRGFLYANILGQLVPAAFLFCRLRMWEYSCFRNTERTKVLASEMIRYSAPLLANTLAWWVNTASDKYVVTLLVGVSANGLLSVAYKIPTILNTLQSIFTQSWQISAVKEFNKEGTKEFYCGILLGLNVLLCVSCSVLIVSNRLVASILFAKDFYSSWKYVPFLLVSTVINGASGIVGPILSAQKNSKAMANAGVVGVTVNVVLNFILVYLIGIQGATIATVISSVVIFYIRKKAVGDMLRFERYWTIIVSWGLLIVQACIEVYWGNYITEILVVFVLLAINYKGILTLWNKLFNKHKTEKR